MLDYQRYAIFKGVNLMSAEMLSGNVTRVIDAVFG